MRRVPHLAVAVLTAAALAFTATACGDDDSGSGSGGGSGSGSGSDNLGMALAYDIGGRGDQSFNDAAAAGFDKAKEEFGWQGQEAEPSAGESDADKAQRLTDLAKKGYDPIVAVGFVYAPAVKQVAAKFPDTTFGIIDDSSVQGKNIANLVFAEEQGSYLAGVVAAKVSKTKTVGFVGGVETALIRKFEAGYKQGVADTDDSVKVLTKYLSQPPDFSGFEKPDLGKEAAQGQLDQNADVIYQAAGGAGRGVIEATAGADKWAIGVDSDQYQQKGLAAYKDQILTSVMKNVSGAVFDLGKSVHDGKPETGVITYTLKNDGVSLSQSNPAFQDMADVQTAVKDATDKIINGDIKVRTTP
ncbi:Membrane lipoprotein TmpC [Streptomyces sp. RB5]|uniref:Membrane lipoprotein TmpC n=1 Tax=Streptomyces smaragdinus TaxID=2585196 RepID=A0A7K0CR71_9ACTN|nr:BMP family ABC transporter substrate-binding protein [Streptomyces smaragdinus]MQY15911.1 Membrane lipoprotein TmpC [Streptomyces smaragdinus]